MQYSYHSILVRNKSDRNEIRSIMLFKALGKAVTDILILKKIAADFWVNFIFQLNFSSPNPWPKWNFYTLNCFNDYFQHSSKGQCLPLGARFVEQSHICFTVLLNIKSVGRGCIRKVRADFPSQLLTDTARGQFADPSSPYRTPPKLMISAELFQGHFITKAAPLFLQVLEYF